MAKLGATGEFPDGKLNKDDEGALRLAVGHDPEKGTVIVDFGKPVHWLGMPPREARAFANGILKHANALDEPDKEST